LRFWSHGKTLHHIFFLHQNTQEQVNERKKEAELNL
jgi:hypothetical protein